MLYYTVCFEFAELLKNAKCMMDCEAAQILQGIQEQMVLLSRDPTIKLPVWVKLVNLCFSKWLIHWGMGFQVKLFWMLILLLVFRSFDRALQYAKTGARYTNPQSVRRILEYPLFSYFLKQFCITTYYCLYVMWSICCWIFNSNISGLKKHGVSDGEVSFLISFGVAQENVCAVFWCQIYVCRYAW